MARVRAGDGAWEARFQELLAAGEGGDALALLEARSTAHAGTPKSADKQAACKLILAEYRPRPDELWRITNELATAQSPTRRELACVLLEAFFPKHRKEVQALMPALADDPHWEVRLWAGELFARLLGAHFDELYPIYQELAGHPSPFVRVAIATSVRDSGHRGHPERAARLLDLVEPLLSDQAHEVGRNLGPFAIGDALLRFFPEATLERVRRWARSDDEQVRWNAAMVFAAAEARKHLEIALELLSELARDPRRRVWQAVSSALRNLVKGDPDRVVPTLQSWLGDERKLPAALALPKSGSPSAERKRRS